MISPEIVLLRYFEGGLTSEEYGELERWYNASEENRKVALELYAIHYAIQTEKILREVDPFEALKRSGRRIDGRRLPFRRNAGRVAAAAAVLLLVGSGYLFLNREQRSPIEKVPLPECTGEVSLVMPDREPIFISDPQTHIRYDRSGQVLLDSVEADRVEATHSPVYHQLVVPAGKRSFITLPDGSKAWVNAGSRLVFPVIFAEKSRREVFVEGEVYLDVVPDKNSPFVVRTRNFSVHVLGTKLNITAYQEDDKQRVILVSGSVEIQAGRRNKFRLIPDQMLSLERNQGVIRQVNSKTYLSWIDGFYSFDSESLEEVANRLSRYYGISVVCDREAAKIRCSGKLELKEDLSQVLNSLAKATGVEWTNLGEQIELRNKK